MLKTAGFIFTVLMISLLLGPGVFSSKDNTSSEVADSSNYAEKTEYADGFSEDDFGEAFASTDTANLMPYINMEPEGHWETLLSLKFTIKFDEELDDVIFKPNFTKKIKALEDQLIELEGFIIPHDIAAMALGDEDGASSRFMFSAFPVASCFFCGAAGAESVIEVSPAKGIAFDKNKIRIRGKLKLNDKDYLKLPYQLLEAELVYE